MIVIRDRAVVIPASKQVLISNRLVKISIGNAIVREEWVKSTTSIGELWMPLMIVTRDKAAVMPATKQVLMSPPFSKAL